MATQVAKKICSFDGCGRPTRGNGICGSHNAQLKRGRPLTPIRVPAVYDSKCLFDGCIRDSKNLGYCGAHYQALSSGRKLKPLFDVTKCAYPHCDNAPRSFNTKKCEEHKEMCIYPGCTQNTLIGHKKNKSGYVASTYCSLHTTRKLKGHPMDPPRRRIMNGEWRDDGHGYMTRYGPKDSNGNKRLVRQHREVVEQHLGRKLFKHENVHHINGMKDDNRIENLEVWSTSQPSGQRVEDKISWMIDFLGEYGYSVTKD